MTRPVLAIAALALVLPACGGGNKAEKTVTVERTTDSTTPADNTDDAEEDADAVPTGRAEDFDNPFADPPAATDPLALYEFTRDRLDDDPKLADTLGVEGTGAYRSLEQLAEEDGLTHSAGEGDSTPAFLLHTALTEAGAVYGSQQLSTPGSPGAALLERQQYLQRGQTDRAYALLASPTRRVVTQAKYDECATGLPADAVLTIDEVYPESEGTTDRMRVTYTARLGASLVGPTADSTTQTVVREEDGEWRGELPATSLRAYREDTCPA